jgi:hypothetical protein
MAADLAAPRLIAVGWHSPPARIWGLGSAQDLAAGPVNQTRWSELGLVDWARDVGKCMKNCLIFGVV